MKKTRILMTTLLLGLSSLTAISAAECQEIRFSNGEKFCFDLQKVATERFQAKTSNSSVSAFSDLSCSLRLPNGDQVSLSRCEGEFSYGGPNGKLEIRADIGNYWYEMITNYDFRNGRFSSSYSDSSTTSAYPEIISVSNSSPKRDERVDLTLRIRGQDNAYTRTVKFYVEQLKNWRWERASSYTYDLERSSYSFSSYEKREKSFDRLVKFREEGEFRLYAELDNGQSTYKTFSVRDGSSYSSRYSPKWISVSDSSPDRNEWVDMMLRIRNNDSYSYYTDRVNFYVEEYRNGRRSSASTYDYQLDRSSYTFSSSDRGEIRLRNFVKFRTEGEFRVIAELYAYGNQRTTQMFYVWSSNTSSWYSRHDFTDKELKKIRAVAEIWNEVIIALEKDYPRLRRDAQWRRLSDDFYSNMQAVLRNSSSSGFRDWKDFYTKFQERLSYTVRTR